MGLESFTYDEINSLDYGMYVTQKTVWDAPKRVVSMIQVAGRNGDLTIDEGKYENARVRYTLKCNAETKDEFAEKVKLFRNELCSRTGYKRLADTYNQGEYRMGVFITEFSVNGQFNNTAGVFDVEFNCKPQRFLTSGETERSIPEWSDLHTDSGSLVTVNNSIGDYAVKSLSAAIVPQQDLNGYDNPWAGGAGKNKLLNTATTQTRNGVTFTFNADGSVKVNGTATANASVVLCDMKDFLTEEGTYTLSGCPSGGGSGKYRIECRVNSSSSWYGDDGNGVQINYVVNQNINQIRIIVYSGFTANNLMFYPMLEKGSTKTAFEPYENICPITGFSSANIYVSPTTSVGDATTYNVSFGSAGTVYGGTLDVVSGQLTVTRIFRQAVASELDSSHWAKSGATNFDEFYMKNTADTYGKTGENYGVENIRCSHAPSLSSASTTQMFTRLANREARIAFPLSMGINSLDAFYAWNQTQIDNNNPLQFCYVLQTAVTYQLTATQVAFLLGTNNIWSDTGDIQIEYGKGGNTLYNPTPFDSLPLIKVTGTGTLGIGDWILTITGLSSQVLYIDCDMMEVYKNTGGIIEGANSLVSINKNTFPKLVSGVNNITKTSGLTNLKITPRWWRI